MSFHYEVYKALYGTKAGDTIHVWVSYAGEVFVSESPVIVDPLRPSITYVRTVDAVSDASEIESKLDLCGLIR